MTPKSTIMPAAAKKMRLPGTREVPTAATIAMLMTMTSMTAVLIGRALDAR